jgi:hypothetical protein
MLYISPLAVKIHNWLFELSMPPDLTEKSSASMLAITDGCWQAPLYARLACAHRRKHVFWYVAPSAPQTGLSVTGQLQMQAPFAQPLSQVIVVLFTSLPSQ